jgi:hypothetical protein
MVLDALVLLVLACALAVLAVRFGHDSRETSPSKEEQLAALGVVWGGLDPEPRPQRPRRRLRRLRRTVAAVLLGLADRLEPRPLEPSAPKRAHLAR